LFAGTALTGCIGGIGGSGETTSNRATTEEQAESDTSRESVIGDPDETTSSRTTTEERVESDTLREPATENVRIETSSQTVSPGDKRTITVKGRNIGSMNPSPEEKSLSLNFDDARFTPRIGPIAETYPPYWHWPSPQSQVTVEIPYQVPEDIPTGVYRFTITGWHSTNHEGEGETEEFTITVGNGATRTETSRAVSETRKPTDDTATTATDICYDMIQFDELSDAAQTEFKTAMDDGGLVKPYHEFHITEEVKFVDDEIGRETCIQMGDNRYYAVDGCKRNECKLKVVPAGTEFQGFNHDYHDENQTDNTTTVTTQG
jgi:hypothetical protein